MRNEGTLSQSYGRCAVWTAKERDGPRILAPLVLPSQPVLPLSSQLATGTRPAHRFEHLHRHQGAFLNSLPPPPARRLQREPPERRASAIVAGGGALDLPDVFRVHLLSVRLHEAYLVVPRGALEAPALRRALVRVVKAAAAGAGGRVSLFILSGSLSGRKVDRGPH